MVEGLIFGGECCVHQTYLLNSLMSTFELLFSGRTQCDISIKQKISLEFAFKNRFTSSFISTACYFGNRSSRNLRKREILNTCSSRRKYEKVLKQQCIIMTSLPKTFDLKLYLYTYSKLKCLFMRFRVMAILI